MTEAIFGLIGVFIGSIISWFQAYYITKQTDLKNAKYLAIRVVCILDKFIEDCRDVVNDDGLSCGQRNHEGCLEAQVKRPQPPSYPDDLDWKSIDHDLMYKLLSFSSNIRRADKIIDFTWEIDSPPNYTDWFEERKFHYAQFGLFASSLVEQLSSNYNIKKKSYTDWDPLEDLKRELNAVMEKREKRIVKSKSIVER